MSGYLGINFLMFLRFFFPRALYEPNTVSTIGYPADFSLGIDQRFLNTNRVLDRPRAGPHLRDLRPLHPSGLHAGMEGS